MFAIVRTGGKQYRVAAGDKIVVEKLAGETGDKVTLGDVLLAGDGSDLKSTSGLTVAAEIIAQAKGDKVTVFKKRRRHNYRRKKGHRQQHTILRIVAIGTFAPKPSAPNAASRRLQRQRSRHRGDLAGHPGLARPASLEEGLIDTLSLVPPTRPYVGPNVEGRRPARPG